MSNGMKGNTALSGRRFPVRAAGNVLAGLRPGVQLGNPVMFLVYICAVLAVIPVVISLYTGSGAGYEAGVAAALWATVLMGSLARALAQEKGKAQARSLRAVRHDMKALRISSVDRKDRGECVGSAELAKGDFVLVRAGEQIPGDGEVVEGAASVDESAITGESAPVIREAGGDRSAVTGGTKVLSDWLVVRIGSDPGQGFLDRMIAIVEGVSGQQTPGEKALHSFLLLLSVLSGVLVLALYAYDICMCLTMGVDRTLSFSSVTALLVCMLPTAVCALLPAVRIAGMSRLNEANVLAVSSLAVETAADVDTLLLDKTGTITLGNRQAYDFLPVDGHSAQELADTSQLASIQDETPEGRSIVVLAKNRFNIRERHLAEMKMEFLAFTAKTGMSGVNVPGLEIRKGAARSIRKYVESEGGIYSKECEQTVRQTAGQGGTPLLVARNHEILGVIHLKDIVKSGVRERFACLRRMGIRTVMVTGDNPLTAAAIAAEAGVDDFLAEATPEGKLAMIRELQARGHMVAMTGDGNNDAPALAQADVAVAMNSGTQAAREAGNMLDLDSSPTKLIEIVRIAKQLLMTRGDLAVFSMMNAAAVYMIVVPLLFPNLYPGLAVLRQPGLQSADRAVLAAAIYNAGILAALTPLALRGVRYREKPVGKLLLGNLMIYGLGGLIIPVVFTKLLELLLAFLGI